MRYILFFIALLLWLLFCWWRYTGPIKEACIVPKEDRTEFIDQGQQGVGDQTGSLTDRDSEKVDSEGQTDETTGNQTTEQGTTGQITDSSEPPIKLDDGSTEEGSEEEGSDVETTDATDADHADVETRDTKGLPPDVNRSPGATTAGATLFDWSSAELKNPASAEYLVDSLTRMLANKDRVEITGLYFPNEKNSTGQSNLGIARAEALKSLFGNEIGADRIDIKSEEAASNARSARRNGFDAIRFSKIVNNDYIKEVDDVVYIYFPYGSTKKLDNPTIENYLKEIANRIQSTNEKVQLTGHTCSGGPKQSNWELGLFRAGAIKDVFVDDLGVAPDFILVDSKGETQPIADNRTKEGMTRNRRVELKLIK